MKTIKSKLLLVYLLFTCITLSSSFYCFTIYRAKENNSETKDLIHLISSEILMLNKIEIQFVAYDSKNKLFFEGAGSANVEKHQALLSGINLKIKALEQGGISNEIILQNLSLLKIQLIHYNNDFQIFISKMKERGFRDMGIEGEMRDRIHKIENSYTKSIDESLLLTIRRNEKDYFLRKDTSYIGIHRRNVLLFREKIRDDKHLSIAEKKLFLDWLDDYFSLFTKWMIIDKEIGIDQGIGLTAKMKEYNLNFENIIQTINKESDRSSIVLSNNNKVVLIAAICISVVLSILLSILFSYIFTKPIKELSDYIDLIVKNNFSVPTKTIKTDSNDEIKDLFDNVNWMVNRVENYINEIKKNETIIEESERKFRSMIENSNDAIALMDKDGKIIYASSSTIKVIGYTSAEMEGRYVYEEIHPEDKSKLIEHLKEVELSSATNLYVEIRKKHKDGDYRWIECHSCNMLNDCSIQAIITNYRDITNRKLSELKIDYQYKELQKVNAELDGFVYSASHDLKAPLLSILGLTNIAKIDSNEETAILYFNMIEKNITKLLQVIKDIINFSRNIHLEVEREDVDFNQIIQDSIQSVSYLENKGKVDFDIRVEKTANFYSDKSRLGMIFSNMISNAISYHNYAQSTPIICISVAALENDQMEIIISDNGQGISPEYHTKIFDMFYRASTDSKGSGLGLYIVKNIIDKMNGTIELTSIPGIGTQFRMIFDNYKSIAHSTSQLELSLVKNEL